MTSRELQYRRAHGLPLAVKRDIYQDRDVRGEDGVHRMQPVLIFTAFLPANLFKRRETGDAEFTDMVSYREACRQRQRYSMTLVEPTAEPTAEPAHAPSGHSVGKAKVQSLLLMSLLLAKESDFIPAEGPVDLDRPEK